VENDTYDYLIIGGGILGAAVAFELSQSSPESSIAIVEKEAESALHQTGNNSGVIHSGLYYKPGSKKAKLCIEGRRLLIDFAKKHHVPHDICGKIVVATQKDELESLDRIFNNGLENGCAGIKMIGPTGIKQHEPHCEGIKGIYVPETGIIDYRSFTEKLIGEVKRVNEKSVVLFECKAKSFSTFKELTKVITNKGVFKASKMIVCGGLFADKFGGIDEPNLKLKVVPFRGDYYELSESGKHKVKHLIYPVPDPRFPFLGVHFTRMINGAIECGPNAVFSFKREGYSKWSFSISDSIDALSYKGTWKLFFKYWRQGLQEYKRALFKKEFLKSLNKLIPSLKMEDIKPARSGVRAQALDEEGSLIYDFELLKKGNHLHVLNAPSPAATACLSIAKEIVNQLGR
jgi:L-2-hydroxyglutarate oxidase